MHKIVPDPPTDLLNDRAAFNRALSHYIECLHPPA